MSHPLTQVQAGGPWQRVLIVVVMQRCSIVDGCGGVGAAAGIAFRHEEWARSVVNGCWLPMMRGFDCRINAVYILVSSVQVIALISQHFAVNPRQWLLVVRACNIIKMHTVSLPGNQ